MSTETQKFCVCGDLTDRDFSQTALFYISVVSAILVEDAWTLNVHEYEVPVSELCGGTEDTQGADLRAYMSKKLQF